MWINIQPTLKIINLKVSTAKLRARIEGRRMELLAAIAQAMGIGSTHTLVFFSSSGPPV